MDLELCPNSTLHLILTCMIAFESHDSRVLIFPNQSKAGSGLSATINHSPPVYVTIFVGQKLTGLLFSVAQQHL